MFHVKHFCGPPPFFPLPVSCRTYPSMDAVFRELTASQRSWKAVCFSRGAFVWSGPSGGCRKKFSTAASTRLPLEICSPSVPWFLRPGNSSAPAFLCGPGIRRRFPVDPFVSRETFSEKPTILREFSSFPLQPQEALDIMNHTTAPDRFRLQI